jgi:hypothetical protein
MKIVIQSLVIDPTKLNNQDSKLAAYGQNSIFSMERQLRLAAYSDTSLKINPAFFDDSDMSETYTLIVVKDLETEIPLLSCRYFYTKSDIITSLSGDSGVFPELHFEGKPFDTLVFDQRKVFLADRLSGNRLHPLYSAHRTVIFASYHHYMVQENADSILLLMVRKDPQNGQLNKYLQLGFQQMGEVVHKSNLHTIVGIDFQKIPL